MKRNWIITSALGLGLTAFIPAFAHADRYDGPRDADHGDRREVRVEREEVRDVRHDHDYRDRDDRDGRREVVRREVIVRREVPRDIDTVVPVAEVPGCVLDTALREGNGRHVELVRFVRRDGREFYLVNMDRRDKVDIVLRITPDGRVADLVRDPNLDGR